MNGAPVLFALALLPYRFLLVVDDQWRDPASTVIEEGNEFNALAALLTAWVLPFDILRLDQERADAWRLLERDGSPRYGTILWAAGPGAPGPHETLERIVRQDGVGLIVFGDSVAGAGIGTLAGVRPVSGYRLADGVRVLARHPLTEGLDGALAAGGRPVPGYTVQPVGATPLAVRGPNPFLTVHGRTVWIGADRHTVQIALPAMRAWLKQVLAYLQGGLLTVEFPRSVLLEMHDMGTSEKTLSPYWHYPSLTEEQIRRHVIAPLAARKARITQVVNTGFVDRRERRVRRPWDLDRWTDELDPRLIHDFASTKRGLEAGLREGVFEIHSHGWTHMLPDLESGPGPFAGAPPDGVATLAWYNEFRDELRGYDIPALWQRDHLARSVEQLENDFGSAPLFFRPGGGAASYTALAHTGLEAARAGFGLARLRSPVFLSPELVIDLGQVAPQGSWDYTRRLDAEQIPWTPDAPYFLAMHDRDIALDPTSLARLLESLGPGVRFVTASEYAGYLHARVRRRSGADGAYEVEFHPHYGRYFRQNPSVWTFVGGGTRRQIRLPPGLRHTIRP